MSSISVILKCYTLYNSLSFFLSFYSSLTLISSIDAIFSLTSLIFFWSSGILISWQTEFFHSSSQIVRHLSYFVYVNEYWHKNTSSVCALFSFVHLLKYLYLTEVFFAENRILIVFIQFLNFFCPKFLLLIM